LVCPTCGWELTDQERLAMISDSTAAWRATEPFTGVLGRHLNGMYRVMGKKPAYQNYLHEFSELWLDAKHGGEETIRVFVNNFDANAYEAESERIAWKPLKDRAENYGPELPIKVVFLLAGVDIHPDRVEIQVLGWGDEEEVWVIDYEVITGDFDMPDCQEVVAAFLNGKRYHHEILGELGIFAKYIDSGKQTKVQAVYRFCKQYAGQNCRAVKGFGNPLGSIYTTAAEKRFSIIRYNVNVDHFKNTTSDRLKNQEPGPRYIHFPKEEISYVKDGKTVVEKTRFTAKYFAMLCSEKKVGRRTPTGGMVTEWVKHKSNTRNEAWDTMIYAFAGWETIRPGVMIKKTWEKVLKALAGGQGSGGDGVSPGTPKEYQLKPGSEAKLPELKQLPATRGGAKPRPAGRKKEAFRGGMFNPLGL
jgi:phage terminase large subunit GpA-like protein